MKHILNHPIESPKLVVPWPNKYNQTTYVKEPPILSEMYEVLGALGILYIWSYLHEA